MNKQKLWFLNWDYEDEDNPILIKTNYDDIHFNSIVGKKVYFDILKKILYYKKHLRKFYCRLTKKQFDFLIKKRQYRKKCPYCNTLKSFIIENEVRAVCYNCQKVSFPFKKIIINYSEVKKNEIRQKNK